MSNTKGKILFADDEERMGRLVSDFLSADGFEVILCRDGKEALDTFVSNSNIDLVILDVMMPRMDGYEALKKIKTIRNVPAMMLTAKGGEYDELMGFSLGVDEYIVKPFRPKILVARVNALLRRNERSSKEKVLSCGDISLDCSKHEVICLGKPVELTGKEFELLEFFLNNKNIVCSRQMLLDNVWDFDYYGDERTVDTHVKKLRAKLGEAGSHIKTVWSVGYKFEE